MTGRQSRQPSPVPPAELLDAQAAAHGRAVWHSIGRRVLVVVFATVFAVFTGLLYTKNPDQANRSWRDSLRFLEFAARVSLLVLSGTALSRVFRGRGGSQIAETFFISMTFIAGGFFVIMCPFRQFVEALFVCTLLGIAFHFGK
jgi:hypothetical protein